MPGSEGPVVVNATPLIALSHVGHLSLLRELYRTVMIPEAVDREVRAGGARRAGASELTHADWIGVASLADPIRADLLSDLDRGEAEVIALALERHSRLVLIDDRLARRHAKRLGLVLSGTLGVLVVAKERGLITLVEPLVARMRALGIRLSDKLVHHVLMRVGERQ